MTKVVPAIIPQTRRQLTEEIKKVSGFAELVQIDISDGLFTPIKTWPYNGRDQDFFEKLKKGEDVFVYPESKNKLIVEVPSYKE